MSHLPPLRVDVALLILLLAVAGLIVLSLRIYRRRRRPPRGIHVDLVGGGDKTPSPPAP
jgi:hypothetical protein